MPYKSVQLQVKAASLAAEARIIRRLEKARARSARAATAKGYDASRMQHDRLSLYEHRKGLSAEARDTQLAQGFLRGVPYRTMERVRYSNPNWTNIKRMALQYGLEGSQVVEPAFVAWCADAGPVDADKRMFKAYDRKCAYHKANTAETRAARAAEYRTA